jgi:acetoin utilization deacetylase AcuC-like enzyme
VLIIDWDYHHGNGTEAVFYQDPGVLFFSTHNWHDYPGTGDPGRMGEGLGRGFNINVHLDEGATDKHILRSWDEKLLPRLDAFRPELILVSAGFDGRHDDPLGKFLFTDDLYSRLTRLAAGLARQYCGGKLVSLLEGGYNLEGLASAVESHVRALVEDSKQAG